MSGKRNLIIVDVESTGLDQSRHVPLEVAAVNVHTGEELYFVPVFESGTMEAASGKALQINRYFERGLYAQSTTWQATEQHWEELWTMLSGNTLGGSNPTFDAAMLINGYMQTKRNNGAAYLAAHVSKPVWHHRLADLAAYAAPAFRLPPNELVGLADVCNLLGVTNEDEHTALGDARATAECFRKLIHSYTGDRLGAS